MILMHALSESLSLSCVAAALADVGLSKCIQMQAYYKEGKPTPFNSLKEVLRWCSYVVLSSPMLPRASWGPGHRSLTVDGICICIEKFKQGIREMVDSAEEAVNVCLRRIQFPEIEALLDKLLDIGNLEDNIVDELRNSQFNYSFLSELRNDISQLSAKLPLMGALLKRDERMPRPEFHIPGLEDAGGLPAWKREGIRGWFRDTATAMSVSTEVTMCMHAILTDGGACMRSAWRLRRTRRRVALRGVLSL